MTTRTLLINHLTGLKLAEWENEPNDITRLDEDPNGFWLIRVPDEEQYFLINPGDTIIFTDVIFNRKADPRFYNSISGVLDEPGVIFNRKADSRFYNSISGVLDEPGVVRKPYDVDRGLYEHYCLAHCASVTFKDYCDKENRLIKVKSYFAAPF